MLLLCAVPFNDFGDMKAKFRALRIRIFLAAGTLWIPDSASPPCQPIYRKTPLAGKPHFDVSRILETSK
jgi:hypothetical protein